MKFNSITDFLFGNWMKPVLFAFIALPLFLLGAFSGIGVLQLLGDSFFLVSCLWLLLSFLVLLFKRQWGKAFYTLLFVFTVIIVLGLLAG